MYKCKYCGNKNLKLNGFSNFNEENTLEKMFCNEVMRCNVFCDVCNKVVGNVVVSLCVLKQSYNDIEE